MTTQTQSEITAAWHTAFVIASLEYSWLCIYNHPSLPGRFELNHPSRYSFQSYTGRFL